jgi:hypothetical protein
MSVCAVAVLMALGPVILGSLSVDRQGVSAQGIDELVRCFEDVAVCPGEATMVIEADRFLADEGEHFVLRGATLWMFGNGMQLARDVPSGFTLFLKDAEGCEEVPEAAIWPNHLLILEGRSIEGRKVLCAYIENLSATSATLSANLSISSSVL